MKRALVIINPCAGTKQANRHFVQITDILCKAGYETVVATTAGRGDGTEIARTRSRKFDLVVCIGGDGTFNEVVAGVLESGSKVPIGYIPAGSTNDFGASLGLSRNIIQATKDIVMAVPVTLDIGSFNDRYFSYVASFGAFTATSYSVPQDLKNTLGHLAYILEGIRDIPSIKPLKLRVRNEVGIYGGEYIFGAVCNSTSMGGIITLDKKLVDMNDGLFEVLLIRSPKNIFELTQITMALTQGKYKECPMMSFFSSGNLHIEADPDMPWTLDGEYQPGSEEINIRNNKSAIRIMVGRDNAAAQDVLRTAGNKGKL